MKVLKLNLHWLSRTIRWKIISVNNWTFPSLAILIGQRQPEIAADLVWMIRCLDNIGLSITDCTMVSSPTVITKNLVFTKEMTVSECSLQLDTEQQHQQLLSFSGFRWLLLYPRPYLRYASICLVGTGRGAWSAGHVRINRTPNGPGVPRGSEDHNRTHHPPEGLRRIWGVKRGVHIDTSNRDFSHWKPPGVAERMWSVN